MKLFEYSCNTHGLFELMRPVGLRQHPAPCPECGKLSPRAYSMPNLNQIEPGKKKAIERNIKSQHEPHVCNTHCCGHHHVDEVALRLPPSHLKKPKMEYYNGPRSWVIEHAAS